MNGGSKRTDAAMLPTHQFISLDKARINRAGDMKVILRHFDKLE